MQQIGKFLILIGVLLVITGIIFWLLPGKTGWFGHLPGDIRIKKEHFAFYFPITSMLLLSAILGFILWLIHKIFR